MLFFFFISFFLNLAWGKSHTQRQTNQMAHRRTRTCSDLKLKLNLASSLTLKAVWFQTSAILEEENAFFFLFLIEAQQCEGKMCWYGSGMLFLFFWGSLNASHLSYTGILLDLIFIFFLTLLGFKASATVHKDAYIIVQRKGKVRGRVWVRHTGSWAGSCWFHWGRALRMAFTSSATAVSANSNWSWKPQQRWDEFNFDWINP